MATRGTIRVVGMTKDGDFIVEPCDSGTSIVLIESRNRHRIVSIHAPAVRRDEPKLKLTGKRGG